MYIEFRITTSFGIVEVLVGTNSYLAGYFIKRRYVCFIPIFHPSMSQIMVTLAICNVTFYVTTALSVNKVSNIF